MFVKPTVLIMDEMGCLKLDPNSAHYLFQVVCLLQNKNAEICREFGLGQLDMEWGA
ncbi:istB-like ATP binding family protein [Geobacillus kaustophilus]|uniref:IstB-like ATP binding family protein n=1 Tax=Geobacillus kaustophilus TaxID=1462 RepID=A0A0D8BY92_GEOKU|nr:istB-like ATP binding family protein [Geobacillus kaustophilus]